MPDSSSEINPLDELAEEFVERYRSGERPPLTEYVNRHPELEDQIRDLFPGLVFMEGIRPEEGEATGAHVVQDGHMPLERLGDYRILREVGRGGMGIVYEAEQVSLGRHVALKVLPQGLLTDAKAKRRFEREAKSAARLHHTNIVPVFGVGEQDGLPYYVMQFIPGLGLDEVLDELKKLQLADPKTGTAVGGELRISTRAMSAVHMARWLMTGAFSRVIEEVNAVDAGSPTKPDTPSDATLAAGSHSRESSDLFTLSNSSVVLPGQSRDDSSAKKRKQIYWQSVARIGVQVSNALEYAHKQGILHRDIKPSNLLLDTQGTVWVTDFGLAKTDDKQNLTHTGDILGTLRYMPPEAFEAKAEARSDVYSLGLTLYEMLAFRPAFDEKERNRLIKQVTTQDAEKLSKLNQQVPRDLETIVHKAIDKDPNHRYSSAAQMAADLQRFIDDEPIEARRSTPVQRFARWCRRNPVVASLTAALALVFLAGFAGVTWKWQDAERQKKLAQDAERGEAEQRAIAEEQADRSRRLLYASDLKVAQQAWEAGDTARARDQLERQWPQAGQVDLRGFEWRYLWGLCRDGSRQTLRGHTDRVTGVAFSPDGRILATSGDNTVRLWDVASQRHVRLSAGWLHSVAFAPDGNTLAILEWGTHAVRLWDMAARCEQANFPLPTNGIVVAFSRDNLLAAACEDGTIRLWDVAKQREVGSLGGQTDTVSQLAFSPDGRTLASGGVDGKVRLWDVAARREIAPLLGHTGYVSSLSFSPDGKLLASASNDTTVRLWDIATKQARILRGQRTALTSVFIWSFPQGSVAISPDGKALATGGGDGTIRLWDVGTGEMTALLRGHSDAVTAVAFAPGGRSLVSGSRDGSVKLWDVAPVPDPNILTGHKSALKAVEFSTDGKILLAADSLDGTVQLWDMASRRPVAFLRGHEKQLWGATFAPGGLTLASTSHDRTVRLWDVASKEEKERFLLDDFPGSPAFSPNGKFLAVGCWGSQSVRVWDLALKREVKQLSPAYGHKVQFNPDGALLASASGNTVLLWDTATWQNVAKLAGQTAEVLSFAFAPNGRTLAVGEVDGSLRLWDVAQQRQVANRRGHTSNVECVTFSPDGSRLATSGADSTIKLWDPGSLREVATLAGHEGPVNSLAFSPDGNTLASASADATIRLWHSPPLPTALREPAKAPSGPPPVETIGLFTLELQGTAQGTRAAEGDVYRVNVTAVDGTDWHAQLVQMFDDLQEGASYTVRFRSKADTQRSVRVVGQVAETDWHGFGLQEMVPLTEQWQAYHYVFQAKDVASRNRIAFMFGNQTGTVWIADFRLTKEVK